MRNLRGLILCLLLIGGFFTPSSFGASTENMSKNVGFAALIQAGPYQSKTIGFAVLYVVSPAMSKDVGFAVLCAPTTGVLTGACPIPKALGIPGSLMLMGVGQ
jgi:hypothetical protein